MGYALTFAVIYGDVSKELLEELAVETRSYDDPGYNHEAEYFGSDLNNGWYLIQAPGFGTAMMEDDYLSRLSAQTQVVTCNVEEHVMYSAAIGWEKGAKTWEVVHDPNQGRGHLSTTGTPPGSFNEIRDSLMNKQQTLNDCDYLFEIPVELVESITGYNYSVRYGYELI